MTVHSSKLKNNPIRQSYITFLQKILLQNFVILVFYKILVKVQNTLIKFLQNTPN
jgi:hypothetical protein